MFIHSFASDHLIQREWAAHKKTPTRHRCAPSFFVLLLSVLLSGLVNGTKHKAHIYLSTIAYPRLFNNVWMSLLKSRSIYLFTCLLPLVSVVFCGRGRSINNLNCKWPKREKAPCLFTSCCLFLGELLLYHNSGLPKREKPCRMCFCTEASWIQKAPKNFGLGARSLTWSPTQSCACLSNDVKEVAKVYSSAISIRLTGPSSQRSGLNPWQFPIHVVVTRTSLALFISP